jgi:poly-beta-1,6-N-acetyl-D-glucosamine biosynthesis protein PgaD
MRAERPIISHPEKQSWLQQTASVVITILAWLLWGYLWLPTLSVVSAVFGMPINQILVVRRSDETSLLLIFVIMFLTNLAVSAWSSYNYVRFAKRSRRFSLSSTSHEDVGKAFGVSDPATLSMMLQGRQLSLYFDDAGFLCNVEPAGAKDNRRAD